MDIAESEEFLKLEENLVKYKTIATYDHLQRNYGCNILSILKNIEVIYSSRTNWNVVIMPDSSQ